MSIKRSLIKNTGFNLAGYFYLLIASFFSVSVLLNNLGRDVFGVYLFLISFISLSAVIDFGISNAVVRSLSLPHATTTDKVKTWKTSFTIFITLSCCLTIIVTSLLFYLSRSMSIFAHIDRSTANLSILILGLIIFINYINNHLLSLPQSQQRFDIFNSKTLLVGSANTIISALVSGIYPNIAILLTVQLIFHILTFVLMTLYAIKLFNIHAFLPGYDRKTGRDLFSFGIRNFLGTLAGQLENQISNIILGALVSARAITFFSIPQSIVIKGAGIFSQFAQAFFPLSASLLQKDRINKLKILVIAVEGITFIGGVLAVVLSFTVGEQFLMWWLHDSIVVESAFPILKILSFYFVLISLTPVPTALLQALNKPLIPSFFGALTVILEIIFSLLFIQMGAVGVAYAFLISVCISVPLILVVAWRQLNKEIVKLHS